MFVHILMPAEKLNLKLEKKSINFNSSILSPSKYSAVLLQVIYVILKNFYVYEAEDMAVQKPFRERQRKRDRSCYAEVEKTMAQQTPKCVGIHQMPPILSAENSRNQRQDSPPASPKSISPPSTALLFVAHLPVF